MQFAVGWLSVKVKTREDFFDDLSSDMFNSLEQLHPPFSPSATNSGL
jgi:hypothetical protein